MTDDSASPHSQQPRTAFVLGGGGVLGACQVGMLRALVDSGVQPDLVVGTSVGALNGALFAAAPGADSVTRLQELWCSLGETGVFTDSALRQVVRAAKYRTHLHSSTALRTLLAQALPAERFEDLKVPFQCVAANVEQARATWFDRGPLVEAVIASCSVPGLLPPAQINGRHYFDGGLVQSIPLGRALRLNAQRIYVLQVGRADQELKPPQWPWEVGVVAFEIARRAHFAEQMDALPADVAVHVLPTGRQRTPLVNVRYRRATAVSSQIERAYDASAAYLADTRGDSR